MQFTSTRNRELSVKFSQAVKQCIPEDGGVFVPSESSIEDLRRWIYYIDENTSFRSIAGTLTSAFIQDEFSPIICETIATQAFPFSPVVTQLDDHLFNLELYHGYTGCYRDFGVSYLCSYLEYTQKLNGGNTVFLDFTNGELGALLSKVLHGKETIKAVVVYKKGTVRGIADEDLVWNGGNIYPVEMDGTEAQIKAAISRIFADKEFAENHHLSVANTTNICRLFGQIFHYPYSFAQIKNKVDSDIYYACDAGNYATLMAGLYSWRFALPVSGFYLPATDSLSTDAGGRPGVLDAFVDLKNRGETNPSVPANLERVESFFGANALMMRSFVHPVEVSEKEREKAAKELYMKYGVFADQGLASSYAAARENMDEIFDEEGALVLISQNHPSLSAEYCRHVIGESPVMPDNVKSTMKPNELGKKIIATVDELKEILKDF